MNYGVEPPEVVKFEKEIDLIRAGKYSKRSSCHHATPLTLIDAALPDAGKDEIDAQIRAYCTKHNLPMPEKIKRGEYKFTDKCAAHVRLIRGQPIGARARAGGGPALPACLASPRSG